MRSAGRRCPLIQTCETPWTWLNGRCSRISVASLNAGRVMSLECTAKTSMGGSLGLALRQVGWLGRLLGNRPEAALIAACTSCAAVSIFFSSVNCSVI